MSSAGRCLINPRLHWVPEEARAQLRGSCSPFWKTLFSKTCFFFKNFNLRFNDNCLIEWDSAAGFFPHDREPQEYDSESFVEECRRRVIESDSDDDVAVPEPRPKKGKTISKGKQGSSKGIGKGKGKGPECALYGYFNASLDPPPCPFTAPCIVARPPSQSSSSAAAEEPQVINHQPVKSAQLGLVELFTIWILIWIWLDCWNFMGLMFSIF